MKARLFLWMSTVAVGLWFLWCLPATLFKAPCSTVLYAADGSLLSAVTSGDGQWRFAPADSVPYKFRQCIIQFEDRNFYRHNGVYLPSVVRALWQNVSRARVVSGASTLSMQVVRLSRGNPPRTWLEKLTEMLRALRLETRLSKDEILSLYSSNAPFGGNVVGLDAAAWRYFGRTPDQLSWAEAATLAVLPNAPALIYPGRNHDRLLAKRNRLLQQLFLSRIIDAETLELSLIETLPEKPYALPTAAPHLLHTAAKKLGKGVRLHTTIDKTLQEDANTLVSRHMEEMEANHVFNAAVLVLEVNSGRVLAYVGNTTDPQNRHSNQVDVVPAPRSTGSILKPLLYAAMLNDGLLTPHALVPDVPMQFDGFVPKNFSESFDGAVPASRALARSLNIPSVVMLKDYGYARFYQLLRKIGFSHLKRGADHYGLSLILGGGEASLWDICNAYAGMSRTLNDYYAHNHAYRANEYGIATYVMTNAQEQNFSSTAWPPLNAASVWCTMQALLEVNRPETELGWEAYSARAPIAWKTGTSFGNRDAWAVGTTPEYVVGVWIGNANGEGRPQLTGVQSAAPLLFRIFGLLRGRTWFHQPFDEMSKAAICRQSGMRCGIHCPQADSAWIPATCLEAPACGFHRLVHLDKQMRHRVTAECASPADMVNMPWFVLPPLQAAYYSKKHPEYRDLPPYAPGCGTVDDAPMALVYPRTETRIYIPRNLKGEREKLVLEATHRNPQAVLYWHLGNKYLGETRGIHQMELFETAGRYLLVIEDEEGQSLKRWIELLEKR